MATQVLPENNVFTGTDANEFANSTVADESFTMGASENVINFDLSNNNHLGTDEIHLTPGEDLTLNFYALNSSQIKWERVGNDIVIKTLGYQTWGYAMCVVTASDIVDYVTSDNVTYYKSLAKYYLYNYETNEYVLQNEKIGRYYSTSNQDYNVTYYGRCYVNPDGSVDGMYSNSSSNNPSSCADAIGQSTGNLDYENPINTITIKDVGAENAANSVKLQYQYKSGDYIGNPQVIVEDFLTQNYTIGLKSYEETTTEDQILQGSFLNETFRAGYGNDTINTVGGTNTVNLYNGGKDVITLGVGADTVNGTFAQGQAQGHYEDLGTNTVANGGITIINGESQDTLQLSYEGNNYFYKNNNNLVIIQNYQYNGGSSRLSKFTVEDYFANEDRIKIKNYDYTVSFNESDTEVYCQNADGYIYVADKNRYLDTDGEIYTRDSNYDYSSGTYTYTYTHVTQNSTIKYNRLGLTLNDFSENRNTDGYYETGEINGRIYYISYKSESASLCIKENDTYTQLVEYKSAKFANDLDIVWEKVASIGSIVESDENTVNGTDSSEAIIATAQSTITTGDGDDTIYTTSANDTIIIDGSGAKTIVIDPDSGVDTIDIQNTEATVYIDLLNVDKFKFYKDKDASNKDLIIERIKEGYIDGEYKPTYSDRTIIKNYFDTSVFTAEQKQKVFIRDVEHNSSAYWIHIPIETSNVNSYIPCYEVYIEGDENVNNTIAGTNHKDRIIGSGAVDNITTGKGDDIIIANKGDDVINIDDTGTKTIRFAKGDGNDTINLSGNALVYGSSSSYLNLSYTDGVDGISYQINDNKLTIFGTRVEGDTITTDSVTIDGITGGDVTAENIADYNGTLNVSGKISFYKDYMEFSSYYSRWYERSSYIDSFNANTPYYIKGSGSIVANNVSNLVEASSEADTINATGQINKIFAGAGNDIINVDSSISSTVYAGSGDDEINIEDGVADIYPGSGADVINIKGGTGGTLNFTAGEGNKTVNFIGASEAKYDIKLNGYQSFTSSEYTTCKKEGNNFIIELKYYDSEEGINKTETHTLVNFFDSNHCKTNSDNRIYYSSSYTYLSSVDLNVTGNFDSSQNATVFEGTVCEDIINGTDGVDIITTGFSSDSITAGKGDDIITLNGGGSKYFYYSKGDGNDTVIIGDGMSYNDDFASGYSSIYFYTKSGSEYPDKYAYTIQNNDLTIYRIYNNNGNAVTDSTTITGIKGLEDPNREVTYENIVSGTGGLNISNGLYVGTSWSNVGKLTKGDDNSSNTMTTNEGENNVVMGGQLADTVVSQGNRDYISTGDGNDSIISSAQQSTIIGGAGNDTINITSGYSTIEAGAGNDVIKVNAESVNIHAGAGSDTISVESGYVNIYADEGNDKINIKGGQGTIYLLTGSGNDTITFENNNANGTCDLDGVYNINLRGWDTPADSYDYYDYGKLGDDLIVTRYKNSQTDTLTIKGLFGSNQLSDGSKFQINGYTLSSMNVAGKYDKAKGATVFSGSNYSDNIYGTEGNDIVTTGAGDDYIYTNGGNDTITVDGSGNKYIYYEMGGNDIINLGAGVNLGSIMIGSYDGRSHVSSYKIENNDFIWYRTYFEGDDFTTNTTRITGITGGEVTYSNIENSSGGLNISGKLSAKPSLALIEGDSKKANNITTKTETSNFVLGGKKKDTIVLNGMEDAAYTGAGADNITVNGAYGSDTVKAGSGNDIITLNAQGKRVDVYSQGGNDTIYANGTGRYNFYREKGDGSDTIVLGKDFNQRIYFYNASGNYPTQSSYQIINGELILYNVFVEGDDIITDSIKITGIKSRTDSAVDVTFNNISSYSGGLNISGSSISDYSKNMVLGNAKKANTLTSKQNSENVVVGGSKNDVITLNGSYDYVYASKGNDIINVKSRNNAYIYGGSGNDTINLSSGSGTIYIRAGEGNDTITLQKTDFGDFRLRFENYNSYNAYYKSGNDLLIECTYRDPKGKTKTETHTIKKYFSYNAATRAKLQLDYSVSSGLNIVGEYDKKQKATIFEGTEYRDIISGTKKKDIVYTGEGDDSITAGKGDDEIIINGTSPSQIKFVYINNGDGNDTIKWADNAKGIAYLVVNPADVINSEQSGRDLIITRHFQSGNAVKSETTTIVDFYDKNGNPEMYTIGDYEYSKVWVNSTPIDPSKVYNRVDYTTSTINVTQDREFAVGTKKADVVTLTSADSVIYALAGNDTINVNGGSASITSVAGGKGDDTINLNTTGNVAISHASGDGNDIVNFGNNTPSGLRINVESTLFDTYNRWTDEYMRISGKHGLIQSGNDLIYSIPTSSAFNAKTESITFKDYFAEGVHKPDTITLNLSEYDYHYGTLNGLNDGIWVEGKEKNGVTTYTGLEDFNNRYEYKGSGKAKIKGSTNTDYYNISINKNTNLYINDAGGGYSTGDYDTMFINTDYKNLRALFNMNASGKVIVSENDVYSDNFMLFDKGSLTYDNVKNIFSGKDGKGVVNIDHFFGETTDYSANGSGAIEKVFAGKNILKQYYNYESSGQNNIQEVGLTLWIEDLGMDVANWLSANTDGTKTSFEIFETGTKDEINALLKVYNTVYDKTFTT